MPPPTSVLQDTFFTTLIELKLIELKLIELKLIEFKKFWSFE